MAPVQTHAHGPPVASARRRHTWTSACNATVDTLTLAALSLGRVSDATSPGSHVANDPMITTISRLP